MNVEFSVTKINYQYWIKVQSDLKGMVKELIYEVKYQSSARPGRSQTRCHPLDLYPQTKVRLGVSKNVLKVLVAQMASKLHHLKVFDSIFLYIKVEQKL